MSLGFRGRAGKVGAISIAVLWAFAAMLVVTAVAQDQANLVNKDHDAQVQAASNAIKPPDTAGNPAPPTDPVQLRQKQLEDDTAALLKLANELKAEMDKSTKDTLSLSVMKKADEIEKLARKVRAEMKTTMGN